MLSYQHGYHAGNFADVIKHFTLSRLLSYVTGKEKPLFYLETHSGRGVYDLKDNQAKKTKEYLQGISLLWEHQERLSTLFTPYLQTISKLNAPHELRFYPGSPYLAMNLLRSQDRLFCCELHPKEFDHLQALPHQNKKIHCSHSDGVANLTALLPPPERRGLVFIDPSYEIKNDYKHIPLAIKSAYLRFSTGIFCVWFPWVDKKLHEQIVRGLANIGAPNKLHIEFYLNGVTKQGMVGCGLWIINPPYVLANEMKIALQQLSTLFNPGTSSFIID